MPTGGGKSLCYQLPAMVRAGTGVVVSPLISLMKDQVDALLAAGVSAAAYNSSLEAGEARSVLRALHAGELDLLYVAPETLMTEGFLERLRGLGDPGSAAAGVALFAIDEAHCVSQWGHDFRPEYVQLGRLRGLFPGVPIMACTATADPETRDDVRLRLGLADAAVYVTGFDRPNIRYTVVEKREPLHQLLQFLAAHEGESGIVYCLSRKRTEEVAEKLRAHGVEAAAYHAGLPADERRRVQDAFARDEVSVVVATVAFGMGIDKSDVRFVVHHDLPKTVESYYQETGRSGRDGLPADALLLFGLGDAAVVRSLIEGGGRRQNGDEEVERDPERVRIEIHKLNSMVGYADGLSCRREALLGYFGEPYPAPCGNCDICLEPPETFDATEQARMALSCVFRLWERDGFGYGVGYVIDVLRGSENEKILSRGHDALSTYGIGAELSRDHWQSLIRQLIHRGYLAQDIARYSALRLTEAARPLLRGDETLIMAKPRVRVPSKKQRLRADRAGRAADLAGMPVDEALFDELRALRKRLADEQNVPAYVVFSDATLAEMAARQPGTSAQTARGQRRRPGQARAVRRRVPGRDRRARLRRLGPRRLCLWPRSAAPATPARPAREDGGRAGVVALRDERPLPLRHRPARPRVPARRRAARARRGAREAGPRRRRLLRLARDGVPRLPLVAGRRPRPAAGHERDGRRRRRPLQDRAVRRLVAPPRGGRHAGGRLHRRQRQDPGHALRRGAHQGRDRRPVPRLLRRPAAVGGRARARRARQRAPREHARGHLDRPERPEPAPARLPGGQGPGGGAAQGEPGRRPAALRGLAERGRRRRQPARPAVRVGHAADRGGADGGRRRARPAARGGGEPSRARRRPSASCTGAATTPRSGPR